MPPLWRLAWPLFIKHLLHVAMGVVATLMVGHLGNAAVAAWSAPARCCGC